MAVSPAKAAWFAAVTLWAAVLALASSLSALKQEAARQPVGVLTRTDALDQTWQLWHALGPPSTDVRLVAQALVATDARRRLRRAWDVECYDQSGSALGSVVWDAATGRLDRFIRQPAVHTTTVSRALPMQTAQRIGWATLSGLGMADRGDHWRPARPARREGNTWLLSWRGRTGAAAAAVDVRTGEVLQVMRTHLSEYGVRRSR
jgi:hypothetical protein